jgi:hypothetical protein
LQGACITDHDTLIALNRDYIQSVQKGDVARFDEILADDFLCSNPDSSLVDKKAFLAQTARPVTISNLEAHDVGRWLAVSAHVTRCARRHGSGCPARRAERMGA